MCPCHADVTVRSYPPQTYRLTSDDFADILQSTSHVLISPTLSLEARVIFFFSTFRDNKCSQVDSQMRHCGVGRRWLTPDTRVGLPYKLTRPSPPSYSYWFPYPITFDRPVKTSIPHTYSYAASPTWEWHALACSTHVILRLNYLIHDISNSQRAPALL